VLAALLALNWFFRPTDQMLGIAIYGGELHTARASAGADSK